MQPNPTGKHPEPKQIERFAHGEATPAETATVVRHLLNGCPKCREVIRPLWGLNPMFN
jgi:hypothetical protein